MKLIPRPTNSPLGFGPAVAVRAASRRPLLSFIIAAAFVSGWCNLSAVSLAQGNNADSIDASQSQVFDRLSEDESLQALELISKHIRQNFEQLRTWSGKYQIQDKQRVIAPEIYKDIFLTQPTYPLLRRDYGELTFDIDIPGNKVAVDLKLKPPEFNETVSGNDVPVRILNAPDDGTAPAATPPSGDNPGHGLDANGFFQRSIVSANDFLSFEPHLQYGDFEGSKAMKIVGRAAFRYPVEKAKGQEWGVIPDPRAFFGDGSRYFEEIDRLIKAWTFPESKDYTAKQRQEMRDTIQVFRSHSGAPYYYKIVFAPPPAPGKKTMEIGRIYSEQDGFNPTLAWQGESGTSGIPGLQTTLGYRLESGVQIPVSVVRLSTADKESIKFHRVLKLLETRVNQPIDSSRFTVDRFDLKDGERLVDRIDGAIRQKQGREMVDVNSVAVHAKNNFSLQTIALVANIVLVVAALVYITPRMVRRPPPTSTGQ